MEREIHDPSLEGIGGLKGINKQKEDIDLSSFANFKMPKYGELGRASSRALLEVNPVEGVGSSELGKSRYDEDITTLGELNNLQDTRAELQPWWEKIGYGVVKGGVLTATTFADGIAGTIVGALNVLGNIDEIAKSDNSLRELGNKFISNPFSVKMAEINKSIEDVLINYYSKEEQEGPWYNNIFTANFIGDKFLKNLGFTIGAAYSGKMIAGVASKAMNLKGVRDAFKGAVTTASGKVLNSADEIARAYKTGDAFMDGVKLTEDLGKAAKRLKNAEWQLKVIGALSGAMGEGRIEAINNSDNWFNSNKQLLEDNRINRINSIEQQLWMENPELFTFTNVGTPDNPNYKKILTKEGQLEWEKRKKAIEEQHTKDLKELAKYKASMANTVFGLNVAVLSASNMWQFGRFLSGGYTSGRQFKNLVKGSRKEGFNANKSAIAKQYASALSNPLVEMNEEMSQALISETAGLKYASDLNNFYGAKINPEAELESIDWLNATVQGINNTYGNIDRWEEGFLGFLTGALGIPKIRIKTNSEGHKRPSLTLEGELWEGLRDVKNMKAEAASIVDAINKRVQSPDFVNYYQGIIRHNKYQNDLEAALDRGSNYDHKNAEHSQFVSDAIMFDKAGRLQDLYEIIEEADNVTLDDVNDIKSETIDKQSGKSIFEGKTDEEIVKHVKKQAKDAKSKLDSYVKISNDLKTLYGDNISSDHLEELTWMLTQIDDWENRTKSLIDGIKTTIGEKANELQERFGVDVNTTIGNLEWMLSNLTSNDNIIDEINRIVDDKNISIEEQKSRIKSLIKEKNLEKGAGDARLGREIQHIRKKAASKRKELQARYDRLIPRLDNISEEYTRTKEKATQEYKKEIERISAEVYEFYMDNSHYGDMKLDDLRIQAIEAFEKKEQETGSLQESLKAVEDYLYREVLVPLVSLEGKRGESSWERSREQLARNRHSQNTRDILSQIVALEEMLTSGELKIVNPLEVEKLGESLIDLIKLYTARSKFISKYSQLSKNPELFTEEAQQEIDRVTNNIKRKKIDEILSSLESVTSVKEFRKKVKDVDPETLNTVLEEIEQGENKELKEVANNYKEIEDSRKVITDIINVRPKTPELVSSYNIIKDALDNAETLEEAKTIIASAIGNINENIEKELLAIMDEYTDLIDSKKSTKKDSKKPKKKIKKKSSKKKFSLSDVESEEDTEDNETTEEDDLEGGTTGETTKEGTTSEDDSSEDMGDWSSDKLKEVIEEEGSSKDVKELAKQILSNRSNPPVHSEDSDTSEGNSEKNVAPSLTTGLPTLRSWISTKYDIHSLKDRNKRQAIIRDDAIVKELDTLGAFDFVDKGYLGDLFNDNQEVPIRYIHVNEGPLKDKILLAVKVNSKVKKINSIIAQNGEEYQIVGALGFEGTNSDSVKNYNYIADTVKDERSDNTSKYFVSDMTNQIKHIYSGRMVKSSEEESVRPRLLQDILHGERPHFGVYYNEGDFRTPSLDSDAIVVPLNRNNDNPREGSMWLMVKEADGRYYAKSVTIARFNSSYNTDENSDTPIIKEIRSTLRTIVNPKSSHEERLKAKFRLTEILYFPEGTSLLFNDSIEDEVSVSITGLEDNIGEGKNLEDKVEELFYALQSDELDLRFQVSVRELADPDYVNDLLESNIVTTDLLMLHNINASFDLYLHNTETGEPITDSKPKVGHTGREGVNPEISGDTIIHNGQSYKLTDAGVFKDNVKISDQNTIDEVKFISQIKAGAVTPVNGNLYVGTYSNGNKFGVVNYHIKTGEELEKLLNKSKVDAKKADMNDLLDAFVTAEDDDLGESTPEVGIESLFVPAEDDIEVGTPSPVKRVISKKVEAVTAKEETIEEEGPSISDNFDSSTTLSVADLNTRSVTFDSLVRSNRSQIRSLGFNSVEELQQFIQDNNLPDPSTITNDQQFNSLLETIKNCR